MRVLICYLGWFPGCVGAGTHPGFVGRWSMITLFGSELGGGAQEDALVPVLGLGVRLEPMAVSRGSYEPRGLGRGEGNRTLQV